MKEPELARQLREQRYGCGRSDSVIMSEKVATLSKKAAEFSESNLKSYCDHFTSYDKK